MKHVDLRRALLDREGLTKQELDVKLFMDLGTGYEEYGQVVRHIVYFRESGNVIY